MEFLGPRFESFRSTTKPLGASDAWNEMYPFKVRIKHHLLLDGASKRVRLLIKPWVYYFNVRVKYVSEF